MSEIEHEEMAHPIENGDGKGKFKFESTMRREEAVAYFEAIVSGLKQGILHFKQRDRGLTVNPASVVDVEVKAAKKGKEARISFEISWGPEHETDLEISSS
jgi:amphi-Trp domain-containing protein